eukprot:1500564-Amphidinium_carterae.1
MVPIALLHEAAQFRGSRVVFFVDNSVALQSLVKGASNNVHLDRSVSVAHFLLAQLQVECWFEYIPSKSNWSDGLSRLLAHDTFVQAHQIPVRPVSVPLVLWQ